MFDSIRVSGLLYYVLILQLSYSLYTVSPFPSKQLRTPQPQQLQSPQSLIIQDLRDLVRHSIDEAINSASSSSRPQLPPSPRRGNPLKNHGKQPLTDSPLFVQEQAQSARSSHDSSAPAQLELLSLIRMGPIPSSLTSMSSSSTCHAVFTNASVIEKTSSFVSRRLSGLLLAVKPINYFTRLQSDHASVASVSSQYYQRQQQQYSSTFNSNHLLRSFNPSSSFKLHSLEFQIKCLLPPSDPCSSTTPSILTTCATSTFNFQQSRLILEPNSTAHGRFDRPCQALVPHMATIWNEEIARSFHVKKVSVMGNVYKQRLFSSHEKLSLVGETFKDLAIPPLLYSALRLRPVQEDVLPGYRFSSEDNFLIQSATYFLRMSTLTTVLLSIQLSETNPVSLIVHDYLSEKQSKASGAADNKGGSRAPRILFSTLLQNLIDSHTVSDHEHLALLVTTVLTAKGIDSVLKYSPAYNAPYSISPYSSVPEQPEMSFPSAIKILTAKYEIKKTI